MSDSVPGSAAPARTSTGTATTSSPRTWQARPKCARGGCDDPVKAHELCQMHYDRERARPHRKREDRVLPTRARNRAVAALIKAHGDEYRVLYESALAACQEEDAKIRALAEEQGVEISDARRVFRLKRGPAAGDQDAVDRAELTDPVTCSECSELHERGHLCVSCTKPQQATNKKLETRKQSVAGATTGQSADKARTRHAQSARNSVQPDPTIERLLRAGKSAQWVSCNLGEPMIVVMTVLERLRKESPTASCVTARSALTTIQLTRPITEHMSMCSVARIAVRFVPDTAGSAGQDRIPTTAARSTVGGYPAIGAAVSDLRQPPASVSRLPDRPQVVTWEDTTNIATWQNPDDIAEFARDGGWRCQNIGWVVYEDDECIVLAARRAFDKQAHVGLAERIPKRAVIHQESL